MSFLSNSQATLQQRRTFESNGVLLDRLDGRIWNDGLTTLENGRYADLLPLDWDLL
jgi:hypothetical protein